jgi:transcriptional regulator with XRE-family HTH domain
MKEIGKRIREFRESLGMDQQTFAQSIGLSGRDTISKWERGLYFPPADILALLRNKFFLNVDWLLSGEGSMVLTDQSGATPIDAAVQILQEAETETGVTLNQAQRLAVLKILRKALAEDRRDLKELILSMHGGKNGGDTR